MYNFCVSYIFVFCLTALRMAQTISISKKQLEEIFDQKLKPISDSIGEMNESMKFLNSSFEEIKQSWKCGD